MNKKLHPFFVFLFVLIISPTFSYAGGGRIEIENFNGTGLTGQDGIYVQARIYNESHTNTIAGERAEFRVKNARPGDQCTTTNTITNEYGQIFGECFADKPGTITIFVHSLDKGDDSSEYLLTFAAPQATPTPSLKITSDQKQSNITPTQYQTSSEVSSPTPTTFPTLIPSLVVFSPIPPFFIQNFTGSSMHWLWIALIIIALLIIFFFWKHQRKKSFPPETPTNDESVSAPVVSASSQDIKSKAPLLVIIIAWLMLIGGIFSLLGVLPFILLGGFGKIGILFIIGILNLVRGIGLIVVSFGIRHMRRWALYAFTVLTVIAVTVSIYSFVTSPQQEITEFIDVGIQVLIVIYFWIISKKFE